MKEFPERGVVSTKDVRTERGLETPEEEWRAGKLKEEKKDKARRHWEEEKDTNSTAHG